MGLIYFKPRYVLNPKKSYTDDEKKINFYNLMWYTILFSVVSFIISCILMCNVKMLSPLKKKVFVEDCGCN